MFLRSSRLEVEGGEVNKRFPKEIAICLVVINLVISFTPLLNGFNREYAIATIFMLVINFIAIPLIFVLIGSIQKFRDNQFNLWNAYYLGVFAAIFFSLQKVIG